jgi:hypothetical protein
MMETHHGLSMPGGTEWVIILLILMPALINFMWSFFYGTGSWNLNQPYH